MEHDIQQIVYTADEISQRVKELAAQISRDYAGKPLLLVGVLRGAVVFLSDLMRQITIPCQIDFLSASSYGFSAVSSGCVTIKTNLSEDPAGKDLRIVEDILDTGITLSHIQPMLEEKGANSVKLAALLDKPSRRKIPISLDYCGFVTSDRFLVGYGLDYAEKYRNLPYIGILKPEIYQK